MYLACKDIKRYINNEDSSSISFRTFNESPRDRYPVTTLCFFGRTDADGNILGKMAIYKEKELKKEDFSIKKFWKIITGKKNVTAGILEKLPDFSAMTIKLKELTRFYQTMDENGKYINKFQLKNSKKPPSEKNLLVPLKNQTSWPFYLSYQSPNQVCYSQRATFSRRFIKFEDSISLDAAKLGKFNPPSDNHGRLHIYVHYQGQTVRSFGKEVFVLPMKKDETRKRINIRLSGFTVIRRRLDGKVHCHPFSEGDDGRFREMVMEETGCVPPYWKCFGNASNNRTQCVSTKQLKISNRYSNSKKAGRILRKLKLPCEEFSVTSSVDMRDHGNLQLTFQYRSDQYLEIKNMRDFGLISLWSSIGGLVGIFLGFSMFQMSEVILKAAHELVSKK